MTLIGGIVFSLCLFCFGSEKLLHRHYLLLQVLDFLVLEDIFDDVFADQLIQVRLWRRPSPRQASREIWIPHSVPSKARFHSTAGSNIEVYPPLRMADLSACACPPLAHHLCGRFARLIVRKSLSLGLRRTRQWPFTETGFEKRLAAERQSQANPSVFSATSAVMQNTV